MKAIMISIKPKWVAKILNGEKTIEIRKTIPNCDLPIDVYIYCTKDSSNGYLYYSFGKNIFHDKYVLIKEYDKQCIIGNGKVVAKFTLRKVGVIHDFVSGLEETKRTNRHICIECETLLLQKSCLNIEELYKYGGECAWRISNLVIFDRPKELSEFKHWVFYKKCSKCSYGKCDNDYSLCSQCCEIKPLTKAPQSWCYVEV
jgi:predicted transcriptional regulator